MSAQQHSAAPEPVAVPTSRFDRATLGRILEENGTLVVVVAAFVIALLADLRNALVADGWMALLSGREVAQHGLPSHEVLTIWAHGHHWVDQQWLAQLALYGLERLGGIPLVMLVHTVLVGGALAGAALLARRLGASARSVTWVCVPVLIAYFPGAAVMRSQSLAFPLFVAVLWLLLAEQWAPTRRVYAVFPLLVLWANIHGSVVLGAALVSGFGLIELVQGALATPRRFPRRAAVLLLVPWACMLASPYAVSLPGYYREVLVSGGFGRYVTEWAPTTLGWLTAPLYLLVFGGFWLLGRAGRRLTGFEKLVFAGSAILALEAVRNMAWFGLVALVVLPRLADELRPAVVEPARLNRLLATAMLVGVLVAGAGAAAHEGSWISREYPSAGADAAVAAAGPHGKVFANERYADWLLWRDPALRGRVAFDSRFELLTPAQLRRVADFRNRVGDWKATPRGYQVLVLDPQDERKVKAALVRAGDDRVVYADHQVVVLRRASQSG